MWRADREWERANENFLKGISRGYLGMVFYWMAVIGYLGVILGNNKNPAF